MTADLIDPAVTKALAGMAATFADPWVADQVGGHFTCSEADSIATALAVIGHAEAAATFLIGHGSGDEDSGDDDHFHITNGETPIGTDEHRARAREYVTLLVEIAKGL